MAPIRRSTTVRLDDDIYDGLEEVWQRDGIQPSEQIRRALRNWLEDKGVMKSERKRAATRKRS